MSALVFVAASARAAPDDEAFARYVAGDYEAAASLAAAATGAENLALAARALNAEAYFDDGRHSSRKTADRALDYAEHAIEQDDALPEAYLQAAIALAIRGAHMAPIRAFLMNLPARARRNIDKAIALDHDNAWALSTSAAWRIEVARRGGGAVYGADPDLGYQEFLKARTLAPDNIVVAYECALRLLKSRRAEWRADALAALATARRLEAQTAFEAGLKARADALAAAIANGPKAEDDFLDDQP